jgi:hypothetical protein
MADKTYAQAQRGGFPKTGDDFVLCDLLTQPTTGGVSEGMLQQRVLMAVYMNFDLDKIMKARCNE